MSDNNVDTSIDLELLVKVIEQDDLEQFKSLANGIAPMQAIGFIDSYTPTSMWSTIHHASHELADCLKLALHHDSEKIFAYLIQDRDAKVNPYHFSCDQHMKNALNQTVNQYGGPLVRMALYKENWSAAHEILHHPRFLIHEPCHLHTLVHFSDKPQYHQYIFSYLEKMPRNSYHLNPYIIDACMRLAFFNEDYMHRVQEIYERACLHEGDEADNLFSRYAVDSKNFMTASKLFLQNKDTSYLRKALGESYAPRILSLAGNKHDVLDEFFRTSQENIFQTLKWFAQCRQQLSEVFGRYPFFFAFLDWQSIEYLEKIGISMWENKLYQKAGPGYSPGVGADFIIYAEKSDRTLSSAVVVSMREYLVNNHLDKVLQRNQAQKMDLHHFPVLNALIQKKLLNDSLPHKSASAKKNKL